MKWKKKTGAWRASIPGSQFRIKQTEKGYNLSINTVETDWQALSTFETLEIAKDAASAAAVDIAEILHYRAKLVSQRHAHAEKSANEPEEVRRSRKFIRSILKLTRNQRREAYKRMGENGKLIKDFVDEVERDGSWV